MLNLVPSYSWHTVCHGISMWVLAKQNDGFVLSWSPLLPEAKALGGWDTCWKELISHNEVSACCYFEHPLWAWEDGERICERILNISENSSHLETAFLQQFLIWRLDTKPKLEEKSEISMQLSACSEEQVCIVRKSPCNITERKPIISL